MKILFVQHFYAPHIGGVETHTAEVAKELVKKGHKVTVLAEKHDTKLKDWELIDGVKVVRFTYPHIKYLGLITIWLKIFKRRKLINDADVVHVHDVYVWYKPFKKWFLEKPVYTTFHGWEGEYPIPEKNIKLKKEALANSTGTIAVGGYVEKYYGTKTDKIIYGASVNTKPIDYSYKIKNSVLYVGRLEKDTGLLKFLKRLDEFRYRDVQFIGDGSLWDKCEKYGKVHGFTDPSSYFKTAEYVIPGGYLSYIEAKSYGCKLIVYPDNPLKNDYWKEIQKVKSFPTWSQIADEYLDLWKTKLL
jgi:glycosyltransferase involved in cell wall biosynthesis